MVYGSSVTSNVDQQALSALVDMWINSAATKKDYEMPRGMLIPFHCFLEQ